MPKFFTHRRQLIALAVLPIFCLGVVAFGMFFLDGSSRVFGTFASLGFIASIFCSGIFLKSIVGSLQKVERSSRSLLNGDSFVGAGIGSDGEIGAIAKTLEEVHTNNEEEKVLRGKEVQEGISSIVANLARRSQSLLDRQVEVVDSLEQGEEDPQRLESLFKIDHLASRMRRNSESLLVLADAEPSRRRGEPVRASDVLRVAIGEVEQYEKIDLDTIADVQLDSSTAVGLAHLLAELIENASHFSPPDSKVEVLGQAASDGGYNIKVVDHGIGMSEKQVQAANETFRNPPELGLAMGRSLGFSVVGRLAKRSDISVDLYETEGSGVTAVVRVPKAHITEINEQAEPLGDTSAGRQTDRSSDQETVDNFRTQETADQQNHGNAVPESSQPSSALMKLFAGAGDTFNQAPSQQASSTKENFSRRSDDQLKQPDEPVQESSFDESVLAESAAPALTKRKAGASKIVTGESRRVTSSSRKPEEIRSLLSSYREGLKGSASPQKTTSSETSEVSETPETGESS